MACIKVVTYLLCMVFISGGAQTAGLTDITSNSDELILLNVLFRHGDRTPELNEMYPKDPYNNISYFPEGLGQLTKKGKNREFDIGAVMRLKYGEFLGPYINEEVSATSTDYARTKMSCLLVLAGLYPPKGKQVWKDDLNWQPISYDYSPAGSDHLLGEPITDCPKFKEMYDEFLLSKEAILLTEQQKTLYSYLSLHTGLNITVPRDPYNLQFVLKAEEDMGLELPQWTKSVWPGNITDAGVDEYYVTLANPKMQRLAAGFFIKKILNDIKNKISNQHDPKKVYLYSAHENNLAYQLIALDVFHRHIPPYGSYIIYELRKVNGVYGVKVLYEDYSKEDPKHLRIPGCGLFCPLDKFTKILQKYVPLPEDSCVS